MKYLALALALAVAGAAAPAVAKDKPAVNADTKETFAAVSSWVRKEMEAGGRYSYVTAEERTTVESRLAEMSGLLDKEGSVAKMNDSEKTQMLNDQEQVNAILARRDGERLICKNERPVGSHIPVKTCKTYAETERDRTHANQFMQYNSRQNQPLGQGGN